MSLPTQKDIEILVDTIYEESTKLFKYENNLNPNLNFTKFLTALDQRNLLVVVHFRLEKDILVLNFFGNASPYYKIIAYIYALAFIKYDDTINNVSIE